MFFTQYDEVKNLYEPKNSGEILVEKAGYVPAKQQIESMILAGQRLADYRLQQGYDSDDEAFSNYDPTLEDDFEMCDAVRESQRIEISLQDSLTKVKQKKPDEKPADEKKPEEKPAE